ncbi:MAG: hypothetical protein COX70_07970 [Flavobacteriales bacterium CG_4_10_14_0_2_um_filter_32_8]|nr:MAG: hypothetical protein COX70_07970 [Flavobacteriales bacterium CG_4_10_14_0_2_um_filter_32_8]PJB14097.1 MAG: hypothetical protein CO118_10395 [Flavobacteriales bacterium CG_4_9_14_3_um_filter_32_8]
MKRTSSVLNRTSIFIGNTNFGSFHFLFFWSFLFFYFLLLFSFFFFYLCVLSNYYIRLKCNKHN